MKLVTLQPREPSEECSSVLTQALERVTSGQVKSLALVEVHRDGATVWQVATGGYRSALIGGLAVLQHQLASEILEQAE